MRRAILANHSPFRGHMRLALEQGLVMCGLPEILPPQFLLAHYWKANDVIDVCDNTPSVPTLHQLLLAISLLGRWSTSGPDRGNAHFFTATSNIIEGTGEKKRTNEQKLGVNSSAEGELCNTLCMCRLTLVWILAKLPQSNWNADSIFFHWSRPYLLPTGLSAPVSGVDCPCLCPVANCPSNSFVQPTLFLCSLPLPVPPKSKVQNPLSGFAPKQTKESSAWRATYIVLHVDKRTFKRKQYEQN